MKSIFTIIIFLSLVVSGLAQTRNVVVGTNGAVVSPTNFWSADVTNARSGLGLGSAATNPASAFQPSSIVLSNLATGNGTDLTNITATIVGTNIAISSVSGLQTALDGKLATNGNTTGTASNVTGVVALANGGTGASNAASARTSLGATTVGGNIFTLANPDEIRFLRLNVNSSVSALTASDFRTAIGASATVGTVTSVGMTVPSILSLSTPTITSSGTFALTLANQSARQVFIAPSGGGIPAFRGVESDDLPALAIAKITGLQTALDGKLATSGTATLATNVTGIVALANGGTGANSAATARTALGSTTVGSSVFTLNNPSAITFLRFNADNTATALSDSAFRSAIGLGTAATNPATAFQPSSSVLTNLAANNGSSLTNIPVAGVVGALSTNGNGSGLTNLTAANVTGTIAISNGGSGATTAGGARTNLGLGWTALTNSNAATSLLGVANNGNVVYTGTNVLTFTNNTVNFANDVFFSNGELTVVGQTISGNAVSLSFEDGSLTGSLIFDDGSLQFQNTTNRATTRTNLGLGWSALTNSNAATSLLGVANNGQVVYTGTNALTFTNTVFFGDDISISNASIKFGGNEVINLEERVLFGDFTSAGGLSFQNTTNAATTRTNLGLGLPALTNTNTANFYAALGFNLGTELGTPAAAELFDIPNGETAFAINDSDVFIIGGVVANFRSSLGIPLPALTNTSNVTAMRALAGSTNTNQPFSGTLNMKDTNDDNVAMIFSNGILLSAEVQ